MESFQQKRHSYNVLSRFLLVVQAGHLDKGYGLGTRRTGRAGNSDFSTCDWLLVGMAKRENQYLLHLYEDGQKTESVNEDGLRA